MLEKFDADGDGTLDKTERAAARTALRERLLREFDADGNGTLDKAERRAARAQRKAKRAERKSKRDAGKSGGDGATRPRRIRDASSAEAI